MNVVDSSGWLAYFAEEENADFFATAIEDKELLVVPTLCIHEVFKVLVRERGEDHAFRALGAMNQGHVVDLTLPLAVESAACALNERLATADAVLYATALSLGATLWTQDAHFQGKPSVKYKAHASRK